MNRLDCTFARAGGYEFFCSFRLEAVTTDFCGHGGGVFMFFIGGFGFMWNFFLSILGKLNFKKICFLRFFLNRKGNFKRWKI